MNPMTNIDVYGIEKSIARSKYPMSVDTESCTDEVTDRVNALATCEKGSGHDQFLTGIICQFDLTFTIKAWVEAERYHYLDFVSSQSTMHRITKFDPEQQLNRYVDPRMSDILKQKIRAYNENPNAQAYLNVLYNIPVGFKLTAGMTTNYRQLKTIYSQRHDHRLPEWRQFCSQLKTLPHSEWITGGENNDE